MIGGCACGAVRYRLAKRPLFVHACHCRHCQRETGSAFVLNALIEAAAVERLQGETVPVEVPSESGTPQIIHRCLACSVALWSIYPGAGPQFLFLRVGTLEEPDACPPDIHIFTQSKQPWVLLPESVPAVPRFYRRGAYWPEESLQRRTAAL